MIPESEKKKMLKIGFSARQIKIIEANVKFRAFENFKAYLDWVNSGRPYHEKFERNMKWQNERVK